MKKCEKRGTRGGAAQPPRGADDRVGGCHPMLQGSPPRLPADAASRPPTARWAGRGGWRGGGGAGTPSTCEYVGACPFPPLDARAATAADVRRPQSAASACDTPAGRGICAWRRHGRECGCVYPRRRGGCPSCPPLFPALPLDTLPLHWSPLLPPPLTFPGNPVHLLSVQSAHYLALPPTFCSPSPATTTPAATDHAPPPAPPPTPVGAVQGGRRGGSRYRRRRCRGSHPSPPRRRVCPLLLRARLPLLFRGVAPRVHAGRPPLRRRRRWPPPRLCVGRRPGHRWRRLLRRRRLHRRVWPRLYRPPPPVHRLHRPAAGGRPLWRPRAM